MLYKHLLTAARRIVLICDLRRGGELLMITTHVANNGRDAVTQETIRDSSVTGTRRTSRN